MKTCIECNVEITQKRRTVYCSGACHYVNKAKRKNPNYKPLNRLPQNFNCKYCLKPFKQKYSGNIFCSTICQRSSLKNRKHDCETTEKRKRKDLETFQTKFLAKFPHFEYISGYNGCDSVIQIRCRDCDSTLERSAQCVRRNKILKCECCTRIKSNEQLKIAERKKVIKKLLCLLKQQTAKLKRDHELNVLLTCKQCGDQFKRYSLKRTKYCSSLCSKRFANKTTQLKRETRLKQNGPIDYSISLEKLIKKHKGVCALCNLKVIRSSDVQSSLYPSIDHIVPVSKGGTHTWDNVQLAHRGCNSGKSNESILKMEKGMLLLNI